MIEIKVTVEMPGIPEALNAVAAAIKDSAYKAPTVMTASPAAAPVVAAVTAPVVENAPAITAPVTAPVAPVATVPVTAPVQTIAPVESPVQVESKPVTLDDISRVGAELVDAGKMADLVNLLKNYGVPAITQLKEEQLASFAAGLRALGGKI